LGITDKDPAVVKENEKENYEQLHAHKFNKLEENNSLKPSNYQVLKQVK
jgi:hypothetical protein